MSYTPTTWNTGDTITASALNKMEQGIADGGGSGYDFVITGEWDDEWTTLSLESGTYSSIQTAIQNGELLKGVFVGENEDVTIIYHLAKYSAGNTDVYVTFMGTNPDNDNIGAWYFIIASDGTVIAD